MAKFLSTQVRLGKIAIDDVPSAYRKAVDKLLS